MSAETQVDTEHFLVWFLVYLLIMAPCGICVCCRKSRSRVCKRSKCYRCGSRLTRELNKCPAKNCAAISALKKLELVYRHAIASLVDMSEGAKEFKLRDEILLNRFDEQPFLKYFRGYKVLAAHLKTLIADYVGILSRQRKSLWQVTSKSDEEVAVLIDEATADAIHSAPVDTIRIAQSVTGGEKIKRFENLACVFEDV